MCKLVTPVEQLAYLGCPKCLKKVTDSRATGFFCNNCKEVIQQKHMWFIHAIFQDFTEKIVVGFSREQAQSLMNGTDADTFMNTIRKGFKGDSDCEAWLNDNLFFQTYKILIRARNENFKGETRQRFYALDVQKVDCARPVFAVNQASKIDKYLVAKSATLKADNQ